MYGVGLMYAGRLIVQSRRDDPKCREDQNASGCFSGGDAMLVRVVDAPPITMHAACACPPLMHVSCRELQVFFAVMIGLVMVRASRVRIACLVEPRRRSWVVSSVTVAVRRWVKRAPTSQPS